MHSLYSALIEPHDCLVLDGDIIYNPEIIKEVLNSKDKDSAVITKPTGSGDEAYVQLDDLGHVKFLGKEKPEGENIFEFIGISKFSKSFIEKMIELHKTNLLNNILDEYYEDCAFRTSNLISWKGHINKDLLWSEIDKKEDIAKAEEVARSINSS